MFSDLEPDTPTQGRKLSNLIAPFVYFGGKSRAAPLVWKALGTVHTYVEPFCGSAAVLLGRPGSNHLRETINDINGFVANFWRSVSEDPDQVIAHIVYPTSEIDLHARHKWLVDQRPRILESMAADPDWCDAKVAGWWAWGASIWFAEGWCTGPLHKIKPRTSGHLQGNGTQSINFDADKDIRVLSERMKKVRALCGDWKRAVTPSVLFGELKSDHVTGVFLDPPYGIDRRSCYGTDDNPQTSADVRGWCMENGQNPRLRIVLAGSGIEHSELESHGWTVVAWEGGGYLFSDNAKKNASLERLWMSPGCLTPGNDVMDLFSE